MFGKKFEKVGITYNKYVEGKIPCFEAKKEIARKILAVEFRAFGEDITVFDNVDKLLQVFDDGKKYKGKFVVFVDNPPVTEISNYDIVALRGIINKGRHLKLRGIVVMGPNYSHAYDVIFRELNKIYFVFIPKFDEKGELHKLLYLPKEELWRYFEAKRTYMVLKGWFEDDSVSRDNI